MQPNGAVSMSADQHAPPVTRRVGRQCRDVAAACTPRGIPSTIVQSDEPSMRVSNYCPPVCSETTAEIECPRARQRGDSLSIFLARCASKVPSNPSNQISNPADLA